MSDSDYRQHMAEYFVQRADGAYTDVSATHVPSNEPTPDEYEPSLVPKGPVADDTHTSAAEEQYEVTTDYSLKGYSPIDSVIQEAPLGILCTSTMHSFCAGGPFNWLRLFTHF